MVAGKKIILHGNESAGWDVLSLKTCGCDYNRCRSQASGPEAMWMPVSVTVMMALVTAIALPASIALEKWAVGAETELLLPCVVVAR